MFSHTNRKGRTYYLHQKGRLYFFSADKKNAIELPPGYDVVESEKTGLPLVKKK